MVKEGLDFLGVHKTVRGAPSYLFSYTSSMLCALSKGREITTPRALLSQPHFLLHHH
jgi:hypothetical protein